MGYRESPAALAMSTLCSYKSWGEALLGDALGRAGRRRTTTRAACDSTCPARSPVPSFCRFSFRFCLRPGGRRQGWGELSCGQPRAHRACPARGGAARRRPAARQAPVVRRSYLTLALGFGLALLVLMSGGASSPAQIGRAHV